MAETNTKDPQQDLAAQWRSFDDAKRTRLLGKMSAEQKHTLRTLLEKPTEPKFSPAAFPPTSMLPPPPKPFLSRVSERVGGTLHGINETITGLIASTERGTPENKELVEDLRHPRLSEEGKKFLTPDWATGPVTRTIAAATAPQRAIGGQLYSQAKEWWQDPANLAGDALLFYMGSGGELPKFPSRARPTVEPRLAPRPVDVTGPGPGIDTITGYPHNLSADQWTAYVEKVNKSYLEHKQDLIDYAAKEAQARSKWVQRAYGVKKSEAANVAATSQKQVLDRGASEYTDLAKQNIRDVHQTVRARLDSRWEQFRGNMRGSTIPAITGDEGGDSVASVINEARGKLRGSPADIKQFVDVMREAGVSMNDDGEMTLAEGASPDMEVDTARVHSSAIGDRLASGNLPGNVYQSLKIAKEGIEGLIETAADDRGQGSFYRSLKRDWSQYMRDWKTTGSVAGGKGSTLAKALVVPDSNFLKGLINGLGGDQLLETFARYKDAGANPDLVVNARDLTKQAADIKVPKVREMPPGYDPATPPRAKEVPVPKPEPPKPGKKPFWKKIARTTSGVAASGVASAAGIHHPIATYVVGAEAGEALYDRVTGKQVPEAMRGPQGTPGQVPPPRASVPVPPPAPAPAQTRAPVPPAVSRPPSRASRVKPVKPPTPSPAPEPTISDYTGEWKPPSLPDRILARLNQEGKGLYVSIERLQESTGATREEIDQALRELHNAQKIRRTESYSAGISYISASTR